jgi:alpha-amylase/alpha-mannosidase (GH57 family)
VTPLKFVAIHGHFYQPPRESPWLERIEVQDSAAPYHDWNERVSAECYEPNTAARRVDGENRILDVVSNFEALAFDVGPTLLAWLERERPSVYAAILDADRGSRATRGRGNAIAQAYGHAILPLCSRRDKVTQVRWGLADFRHRFGREAEGMWLPETAVDGETLAVLAEEGVRFTLLAPSQAASVREPGSAWLPGAVALDPRRAYRYDAGEGRHLALFFYDGGISHAIAFGDLLRSGDALAARVLAGLDDGPSAQLVQVATDGETYGHHHRFGEMALAAACARIQASGGATLTNHAAFLAAHPPAAAVRVVEQSSWSCAHGVERWRGDCGCRAGHEPGWTQRWRSPLREALDWLRDSVDPLFEERAGALFGDPWAARDAYVEVVLDRSPASVRTFLERHARRPLGAADRVLALRCLELERHRLLMYTSCGWFFDEISGIETVQVLRYAARVLELAAALGGEGLETEFVRRLGAAPSNLPALRDGAGVWRSRVMPSVVDLPRVAAHYAIAGPSERYEDPADVHAFRIERREWATVAAAEASLAMGRVRMTARVTGETEEADVAVLHTAPGDVHCRVRTGSEPGALGSARSALFRAFVAEGPSGIPLALDRHVLGRSYGAEAVFLDERRRLLGLLAEGAAAPGPGDGGSSDAASRVLAELRATDGPIPRALLEIATPLLTQATRAELMALAADGAGGPRVDRIRTLAATARSLGIELGLQPEEIGLSIESALDRALARLRGGVTVAAVDDALALLALEEALQAAPGLWTAQTEAARLWRRGTPRDRGMLAPLMAALGFAPTALAVSRERG